jgi:CheY-like chemotaxis protein/anti-sigma regulatory factor (Ser/Thr protein kinase)
MATVLVVDDSPVDRHLAGNLLGKRPGLTAVEKRTGLNVTFATDGQEALTAIQQAMPDLVLTDLQMPRMNGLQLVEEIRSRYPGLPVILMTAQGSEDIAVQALQKGAASYVPKRNLAHDLLETVEEVLEVAGAKRSQQRLLDECWSLTESHFVLGNDLSLIAPLIGHLQDNLTRMRVCDENGLIRVAVALREALTNAMIHGNLELSSDDKARDEKNYYKQIEERREQEPYDDRKVYVTARESRNEAVYTVRDEGKGFDPKSLPDPTDPANLDKISGRGLLLIRTFMDEVSHNRQGTEITMVRRCDR